MEFADEVKHPAQPDSGPQDQEEDAAFISSSVELQVDNEALHLGAKPPKVLTETTARAVSNNMRRSGVQGNVIHLQHSTYRGKPATLLAFKFRFSFDSRGPNRASRAEIRVAFDSHDAKPTAAPKPAVRSFAPALICGPVRVKQVEKSVGITPSVGIPILPFQAGVEVAMAKSATFTREFQMKIVGEPWATDEDADDDDMVTWRVDENFADDDGVPSDFKTAVLVQHGGQPFQATVQVKVRTGLGMSLFGWPWSKPRPLIVSDQESFGDAVAVTTFDELEETHWLKLSEFPGQVVVSLLTKDFHPQFRKLKAEQRIRVTDTSKEKVLT